ncbi:hypothetical protein FRC04_007940 [Tulasnella sp. 424]|nr:hypothetical protein FRC04_007940 [Tulasnella sp. 424]
MVLKDVWLDSDLETEGQKLDAIFEKLKEIARHLNEGDEGLEIFNGLGEKLENALKLCLKAGSWGQYFLTKVCDWQGCESKKAPPAASDRTRTTTLQATYPVPVAQNQLPRRYCPKRQYRIIFEEVCEALHDVEQLRDVATALLDSLMFLAGWVHRDISSGNIYAYRFQESGTDKVRGILADLEFAKLFEAERAEGSSDPRTGTAFFMPVEIQRQILFYNPAASRKMPSRVKPKNKEPDNNNNKSSSSSEESSDEEASESDLKRSIGVIHNFEHDMESIFWLLLWILSVRFPPERTAQQERECQRAVSTIFQNTSQCPPEREQIFTCKGALELFLKRWINPDLKLFGHLVWLRTALAVGYLQRAFNFNDLASYAELYHYVSTVLESCRTAAEKLVPGSPGLTPGSVHPAHVIKRKADVGGGDGNKSSSKVGRVEGSTDAASSRTLHQQDPEVSEHEASGQSAKAG